MTETPEPAGSLYLVQQLLQQGLQGIVSPVTAIKRALAELDRYRELAGRIQEARDQQVTVNTPGRARTGDRLTSHAAAADIATGSVRAAVLVHIVECGPVTDREITHALRSNGSGPRSRRAELVESGHVRATGETRKFGGRDHTLWAATAEGVAWARRHRPLAPRVAA
ncbi:hypothetical protein [Amycolatopsis sp. GM8]|uniref:hypothetical protein n=1 Tax=Amycolatopsis sp. GM8 TaxID=2896530 RepID=UPI001F296996|nr:hypothetical protein [Amycolatopsis sp. GM8]